MKTKEIPVCGLAAVQAVFQKDPASIKRLYFDQPTSRRVAKIASALAKLKRIYRVITPEELVKVGGTVHHGGIVAIIDSKPLQAVSGDQIRRWASSRVPLLLLDRVGNAHNLGAIARTAAFFGLEDLILPDHAQQALPGEAAHRVAEGGLEHVRLWRVGNLADVCRALQPAYEVLGAAVSPKSRALRDWTAGRRDRSPVQQKPIALVMGNEEHGLSPEVASACSQLITIPGNSERVESLNVSVATAVLVWELWGRSR